MANTFDIKKQIIPLYLFVVLLLQIDQNIQNILLVCAPLFIISLSLHLQNKMFGLISIFFFYITSTSLVVVSKIDNLQILLVEIILVILPSLLLLNRILQLKNEDAIHLPEKRPLLTSLATLIAILSIFILTILLSFREYFFLSIEGQILLLAGITILCCTPFLISGKINE